MGLDGQWWEHSTYGDTEFSSMGISLAFGNRSNAMGDGEYASTLAMPELWNILQGADCNDKRTPKVAKIRDRIGEDRDAADLLSRL